MAEGQPFNVGRIGDLKPDHYSARKKKHGGKLMEIMTCILQGGATLLCVSLSVLIVFFIADFVETEKRFKN